MSNITRSFFIPATVVATAVKITDALQDGHQGMFQSFFKVGALLGEEGDTPRIFVSTGVIDDQSPLVLGKTALTAALADTDVTEAEITAMVNALDLTAEDAIGRAQTLEAERTTTVSAADWSQPAGAQDAYPMDALVKHAGETWRSLQAANVFEPGVASWRIVWGSTTDTPPAWTQPSGSTGFYAAGERVSHNGSTWVSTLAVNVWEPGVTGWTEEVVTGPTVERWSQGGGTGTAGSYNLNDEVIWDRPQDGGNDWLFRSKIPANTTQPSRDATFDRWWEPVSRV